MGSLREVNPSLWVVTEGDADFATLDADRRCDVLVIGAGITGLTLGRLLVDDGVDVGVIDAGPVCAGATGYTTAKVTALHRAVYQELIGRHGFERARMYAEANAAAVERVATFVHVDGIDCDLVRAPAVTYTEREDEIATIEREVEAAQRLGLPAETTTEASLPFPVRAAVQLDEQLHLHPRRYCLALARGIRARGGTVLEHTRAVSIDRATDRVTTVTDRGRIECDRVVLATHLPFLDRGAFFARAHPSRSYALSARLSGQQPRAMYISVEDPIRSLRPTAEGELIIGGGGHRTGHESDTSRQYDALEAWARAKFQVEAITHRWSAQDYQSIDRMPYVGRLTAGDARVLFATGFGKWGMTNGTAAAGILADMIAGRDNRFAAAFDSTRLAPRASLVGFALENTAVAHRFVGDRIAALHARDAASLGAGQGGIVKHDGHRVAAYRRLDGTLQMVSPTCTHLGCQVAFNSAERTWDCPCHGSRFDVEGRVIAGPAVRDLESR